MHTNSEQKKQFAEAVKELLSDNDLNDYITELNLMYIAFVRSDIADSQNLRTEVTTSYTSLTSFFAQLGLIQKSK